MSTFAKTMNNSVSRRAVLKGTAGAVGLAALLAGHIDAKGKTVVIVLSGGNVDSDLYARLIG